MRTSYDDVFSCVANTLEQESLLRYSKNKQSPGRLQYLNSTTNRQLDAYSSEYENDLFNRKTKYGNLDDY